MGTYILLCCALRHDQIYRGAGTIQARRAGARQQGKHIAACTAQARRQGGGGAVAAAAVAVRADTAVRSFENSLCFGILRGKFGSAQHLNQCSGPGEGSRGVGCSCFPLPAWQWLRARGRVYFHACGRSNFVVASAGSSLCHDAATAHARSDPPLLRFRHLHSSGDVANAAAGKEQRAQREEQ
eukprot:6184787-Pleurochrysis_carterae.AAC.1